MIGYTPRWSGSRRKLFIRSAVVVDRDNQKKALADKTTAYNNQVTAYNNKVKELQTMTDDRDNQKKALADKTKEYDNNLRKALNSYQSRLIKANRRMVRQLVNYKVAIKFAYYNEKHQILYKDTTADQV